MHDHDETERTGALENAQVFGVVQIDLLIGRVDLDAAHVGRGEAVELLLKKADFEVPESQVRRATDAYLNELAQRAQYSGLDVSYFEKNREKILADAEATATKQVRLWYIIDAIAAAEKIEAKDDEKGKKVVEFILANVKK